VLADAVARIKTETHRFVRHQYSWFRRLPNVTWYQVDPGDADPQKSASEADWWMVPILAQVADFLVETR